MTASAVALLGFASWTLILLISLGVYRSVLATTKGRAANSFSPSGEDLAGPGQRLTRAHANCYEFLPIAGTILLYAIAINQTGLTDGLAYLFIGARLAQSITHLISISSVFVLIRFFFFGIQLVILIWWLLKLFHHV